MHTFKLLSTVMCAFFTLATAAGTPSKCAQAGCVSGGLGNVVETLDCTEGSCSGKVGQACQLFPEKVVCPK
ncbi:hypothetical protein C8034_v007598 [Colletotrichum sidae]|uniref:Uncharacterized protein n=1 Tax=Colletotrichum sidae TaxID=1347389 RepID=A0A4R8T3C5_9PEZI|nr:hypothetical protein C8034_v007598 [Colletotrichum sidae]